jgi:phosphoglycerate dehydrogenase-like enzyme
MTRIAVLEDYQGAAAAQPQWGRLGARAAVDFFPDALLTEDAVVERLQPYTIVVPIRERTRFPASVLTRLPALALLAMTGRNSGHVDLAAATSHGILVADTDGSGAAAVELTMALILATARRVPQEDRAVRAGRWQTGVGMELAGRTLGILGLGRIGTRIAAFGRLLGMEVVAWGPTLTDERAAAAGVRRVELDALFETSDVVSVHLRLGERTRGIVDARCLGRMKPTAVFVNTARGELVDEQALVRVLREGRIAGAGLDVYEAEPLPPAHPLRSLERVVLSPHMGYVTAQTYDMFFEQAVDNIVAFLEGRCPPRALNPSVWPRRLHAMQGGAAGPR